MDVSPVVKGHTLVVPNYHSVGLEGVNFFLADGEAAGQTVFHVLLRHRGDGFGIRTAALDREHPGREALDEQAGWIAAALTAR